MYFVCSSQVWKIILKSQLPPIIISTALHLLKNIFSPFLYLSDLEGERISEMKIPQPYSYQSVWF